LRVYVNGESREIQGTPSLAELITELDLPAARIAVEVNREVVRRGEWVNTMLRDEDKIEIVHFVGGGFVPFCGSDNI
jgi:thiamine biosynthesis protein ThiS